MVFQESVAVQRIYLPRRGHLFERFLRVELLIHGINDGMHTTAGAGKKFMKMLVERQVHSSRTERVLFWTRANENNLLLNRDLDFPVS